MSGRSGDSAPVLSLDDVRRLLGPQRWQVTRRMVRMPSDGPRHLSLSLHGGDPHDKTKRRDLLKTVSSGRHWEGLSWPELFLTTHLTRYNPGTYEGTRVSLESWRGCSSVVVDLDGGVTADEILARLPAIAFGLSETVSCWGADVERGAYSRHRYRLIIPLSRAVTDPAEHLRLERWLRRLFPELDSSCCERSHSYFASADPVAFEDASADRPMLDPSTVEDLPEVVSSTPDTHTTHTVISAPTWGGKSNDGVQAIEVGQSVEDVADLLRRFEPAVSGRNGDRTTVRAIVAAGILLKTLGRLDLLEGLVLEHYNPRCVPPWEPKDITRKVRYVVERYSPGWRTAHKASRARPSRAKALEPWKAEIRARAQARKAARQAKVVGGGQDGDDARGHPGEATPDQGRTGPSNVD